MYNLGLRLTVELSCTLFIYCFHSVWYRAINSFIDWKHFSASNLDGLPGLIKEDILRLALHRGKVENLSYFLHKKMRHLCISETVVSKQDLESVYNNCPEIRILEINPPPLKRYNHPPHGKYRVSNHFIF